MSSITPDSVRVEVAENALREGNPTKTSAGALSQASKNLYSDANSNLSYDYPLKVNQPDNTDYAAEFTVVGLEGVITGTIVNIAGGSTVTQTGALRILVTDSTGIGATTGAYYIPIGTLA